MSTIDTSRFLNRLLKLVDDLELRGHDGLQRVRDHLRDHDPAAKECIGALASAGRGTKGYVGIVNDVHRSLAGAEARGLDPRVVADAVLALVEVNANPFVALQDLGPDHALLSSRASSRLICDWLARDPGYVSRSDYQDADDIEPNMRGLRLIAIRTGGSSPVLEHELSSQVLPNIMELAGKQAPGIEALLRWHRFIEWLRLSPGAIGSSAAALANLDERVLGYLIPAAMQGDSRTESVRRGLAIEEAVRALISASRAETVGLREQRIGFSSADVLFEPFRAFIFASPSSDGKLGHDLIDAQTLAAVERALESASDLRLPPADPIGPSLRETQRRLRFLARMASAGAVDGVPVSDLLFPVGVSSIEREAYRCGFERLPDARISPLLDRAGSNDKRVRMLRLMTEMEVDTFSASADAASPTGFLERIMECASAWSDDESNIAQEVFSQDFIARAAGNLLRSFGEGEPAVKRRLGFFTERQAEFNAASDPIRSAINDQDFKEFKRILGSNFHREFDLSRIVRDVASKFVRDVAQDDPCRRQLSSWVTSGVFGGSAAAGEIPTFGALASMSAEELVREARARPRELHGIFQVPVSHAICYLAGVGGVAAREALATLASANHVTQAELRQLWMVQPDMLGRTSGYALSAACSQQALVSLTGPTIDQEFRAALQFSAASTDGVSALMAASRAATNDSAHRMEGFRWLLANRDSLGLGPVDAHDHRGWRAIHHAVSCGNTDAAQELMKAGASVGIESGDSTSVLVEAFDCASKSRYALAVWFVSGSVLPAIKARNGGQVPVEVFTFGLDRPNDMGMPRTVANVGMVNDHYLRFVQFASDHPEVWKGFTSEAVTWMFTADSGIDRFRMVTDLSPSCAAAAVDKLAIFRLLGALRPHPDTDSISGTIDIIDALRRIKALDVDGVDSQRRSVFHVLATTLQSLPRRFAVSAREQSSLVRALLGANPSAHERAVARPDLDGRSSVVVATSGGQVLLAMLLSRALAARDEGSRSAKLFGAARLIHNPGQLAQLVPGGGVATLQLTGSGEVLLAGGDQTISLGRADQGVLTVDAPREVRNVVDWLNRQDVQAAIESNLAQAYNQPNYAVTFDDFIAWLDHLGKSR